MTDFVKRPAKYLVIVDDVKNPRAREVVYVERQADQPEAREAQWDELVGECLDAGESITVMVFEADGNDHAARLARREYAIANAASLMAEVIDTHRARGDRGWIAIRIADGSSDGVPYGGSDGVLYGSPKEAQAAQEHPDRCTYLAVSPLTPWLVSECVWHLTFADDSERKARELGNSH